MALVGELVLLASADLPLLRHQLGVLAHGQPRARLAHRGRLRRKLRRREALEGLEALADGLGVLSFDQAMGELRLEHDGRIRGGIGAHGDAAFGLPGRDFRADGHGRLQAGTAGLLHRDARGAVRQLGAEHGLARQVPVLGMGYDGAAHHFVDVRACQLVLVDQAVQDADQHIQIGLVGVKRVRAAERRAQSTDDSDAPKFLVHDKAPEMRVRPSGSDPEWTSI